MEGELWKWTNYWNGWQSRWFILADGVLSYYKSFDEVHLGCKGSIHVSASEITVHPHDPLRLDLSVPGEQYMYLKANNEKERQQWLIALGSAKACLTNRQRTESTSSSIGNENGNLKSKKSELRLYCDLLMQQVHTIKTSVDPENGTVDLQKLESGSSLLTETCDTFINTLDEAMRLSDASFMYTMSNQRVTDSSGAGVRARNTSLSKSGSIISADRHSNRSSMERRRTESLSDSAGQQSPDSSPIRRVITPRGIIFETENKDGFKSVFGNNNSNNVEAMESPRRSALRAKKDEEAFLSTENLSLPDLETTCPFTRFMDRNSCTTKVVQTAPFIEACKTASKIYDFLGSSFLPMKIDLQGHIGSVDTRYQSDKARFSSIQSIILQDCSDGVGRLGHSATTSIVWIVRSLMFVHTFLRSCIESNQPLEQSLVSAYENVLQPHHDSVVRSVFSIAVKSCPSRHSFLASIGLDRDSDKETHQSVEFIQMAKYLDSMEKCLMTLNDFLRSCNGDE